MISALVAPVPRLSLARTEHPEILEHLEPTAPAFQTSAKLKYVHSAQHPGKDHVDHLRESESGQHPIHSTAPVRGRGCDSHRILIRGTSLVLQRISVTISRVLIPETSLVSLVLRAGFPWPVVRSRAAAWAAMWIPRGHVAPCADLKNEINEAIFRFVASQKELCSLSASFVFKLWMCRPVCIGR